MSKGHGRSRYCFYLFFDGQTEPRMNGRTEDEGNATCSSQFYGGETP